MVDHALSAKSRELGRDTFVFAPLNPCPSKLVLGFNQKVTPVSSARIQRWARILNPETSDFVICPVNVLWLGVFEYYITPNGPFIDPASTALLPPGNYGLYHQWQPELVSCGPVDLMRTRGWEGTFEQLTSSYLTEEERIEEYQFPPCVEESVKARDKQRCRFTGMTHGLALSWIIPPIYDCQTKSSWFDTLDKDFRTSQNVLTMRSDLKLHFHNNNFSVDVDDGYRIVILRDLDRSLSLLPTHLPLHPEHDALVDAFLRDHFKYSLGAMLLGGDISDTYGRQQILQLSGELVGFGRADERDAVPLSDPRWGTPLGQEILANEIRVRTNLRRTSSAESLSSANTPEGPEDSRSASPS
ncbi:hypothetical protein C8R47DRAFT_1127942 [Mycena vitilis]|nr:hypothetical protein C8R47DRAFT_1127942 [Mycena vitilis]